MTLRDYRDVAGWHAWNMSKRVSDVTRWQKDAHARADAAAARGVLTSEQQAQLHDLLVQMDRAAADAQTLWTRIADALAAGSPASIEPAERGISILRDAGPNPVLTKELFAIWNSDTSIERARLLDERIKELTEGTPSRGEIE